MHTSPRRRPRTTSVQPKPNPNSRAHFHLPSKLNGHYAHTTSLIFFFTRAKDHRLSSTLPLPSQRHRNYFRYADQVRQILEEGIFNSALEAGQIGSLQEPPLASTYLYVRKDLSVVQEERQAMASRHDRSRITIVGISHRRTYIFLFEFLQRRMDMVFPSTKTSLGSG